MNCGEIIAPVDILFVRQNQFSTTLRYYFAVNLLIFLFLYYLCRIVLLSMCSNMWKEICSIKFPPVSEKGFADCCMVSLEIFMCFHFWLTVIPKFLVSKDLDILSAGVFIIQRYTWL